MRQLGFHDPLLDQLIEGMEIGKLVTLGVAVSFCRVFLKGFDLGLQLLVK